MALGEFGVRSRYIASLAVMAATYCTLFVGILYVLIIAETTSTQVLYALLLLALTAVAVFGFVRVVQYFTVKEAYPPMH